MRKAEYLELLWTDNETSEMIEKERNEAIIDCVEIALSQMPSSFEVDGSKGLKEFYAAITAEGRKRKSGCVSPLRAAELIAEMLGAKFEREKRRNRKASPATIDLEEFL